ncbi:MAG TPA: tetratricopeptide repeat protein [Treponemataceae bacterium]|nr:tetratricopeptide repeat protein [Treponemataceae bacterium]
MNLKKMPIVIMSIFISVILTFSCKTTAPSLPVEKPSTSEEKEVPFTRVRFATELEKLVSENRYDDALALFDTVPEPDASDSAIQILKLSILISARYLDEAENLVVELEAQYPGNIEILYIQAMLATARADQTKRTKYLNAILKIEPNNASALTGLALDYLNKKNYKQAKTLLIKAIVAEPKNTDALLGLARVYYMESELAKAGDTLNLAIEKSPEYSVLWAERARVKSEMKDLSGAIKDIKKAIELDPEIHSHWMDLGTYLISSGNKAGAQKAFTEALTLDPNNYLGYIYRAGLNDDLGNRKEAISDYTKVCALFPQYHYASESLGILLWEDGNWMGSKKAFLQALEWNPKNASYALMVTLCSYRAGNDKEAKNFMSQYIATLDRSSTEYFLCRLFVDKSSDGDVLNRITKETNVNIKNRMLFYMAMFYDLFGSKSLSQKYLIEITSIPSPTFFEYRLSERELGKTR